jgi:formylglycine-generating enzyme required for sulfatase activity
VNSDIPCTKLSPLRKPLCLLFRTIVVAALMVIAPGCGSSLPDSTKIRGQMAAEQLEVGEPIVNTVGMTLVPIPAGEFLMGTAEAKPVKGQKAEEPPGAESERPQHSVKHSQPFYIGICEVTQGQFEQVMGETPWKGRPLTNEGPNVAASYVSWEQATEFCKRLSQMEHATYRLPTEAEWEYACRARTTSTFSFGDKWNRIGEYAWFDKNAYKDGEQYAHAAGQKLPNPWSLYDMHGNVWEWCSDFHGPYGDRVTKTRGGTVTDYGGPELGWQRVWRGGGFAENLINLRSATRNSYGRVDYRPEFMAGFRVVKVIELNN